MGIVSPRLNLLRELWSEEVDIQWKKKLFISSTIALFEVKGKVRFNITFTLGGFRFIYLLASDRHLGKHGWKY